MRDLLPTAAFVGFYLVLVGVTVLITRHKGYPVVAVVIASAIGPCGLLFLIVAPRLEPERHHPPALRPCPTCRSNVSTQLTTCPRCGAPLPPPDPDTVMAVF